MTLRQLRYFAVLGEELNYRRAAERLFITQPALSTAIKQLEHQLGVMLFTRSTREVALTELGQAWLPKVRRRICGDRRRSRQLVKCRGTPQGAAAGLPHRHRRGPAVPLVRHFEAAYPEVTWNQWSSTSPIQPRAWRTAAPKWRSSVRRSTCPSTGC